MYLRNFTQPLRNVGLAIGLITIGIAAMAPVAAHMGAEGVVKERMVSMKSIGKHMKAIKDAIQASNHAEVVPHAQAIRDHAARIPALFPEGSGKAPSEAMPAIWANWSAFESRAKALGTAATKMAAAAAAGDNAAVRNGFGAIGGTCSGCHTDFRIPK